MLSGRETLQSLAQPQKLVVCWCTGRSSPALVSRNFRIDFLLRGFLAEYRCLASVDGSLGNRLIETEVENGRYLKSP
jgi:hypothetical protein